MSISSLPLSYCSNVHPGRSVAEVEEGLDRYTVAVQQRTDFPIAAGLWLAQPVVQQIHATSDVARRFAEGLRGRGLSCHTLNAFPYGDFHSERVKEQVYLPDWGTAKRRDYTLGCASILAAMLPEGGDGSISTLPLGFKQFDHPARFIDQTIQELLQTAQELDRLREATGKHIRLAIEPEPFCLLETTREAIEFFQQLFAFAATCGADGESAVHEHLGLCYDVCHQAVEFEQIAESITAIDEAGVRINKVHITCAIQLDDPRRNSEGRRALAEFVEPRYLHQTMARTPGGTILRYLDLDRSLALDPPEEFLSADCWRIHFHVPVDAEDLGPLGTTRADLKEAVAVVADLDYAPHLEVETYTWGVLPGEKSADLAEGLARELNATRALLNAQ